MPINHHPPSDEPADPGDALTARQERRLAMLLDTGLKALALAVMTVLTLSGHGDVAPYAIPLGAVRIRPGDNSPA